MEEVKKGYTCECGKFHPFSAYVFAHYHVALVNVCSCGRENEIRNGIAKIGKLPNNACNRPASAVGMQSESDESAGG